MKQATSRKKDTAGDPRPWFLASPANPIIFAIQALSKGIANQGQQAAAWNYIVKTLCETDRMTFWLESHLSGVDGQRATDFAEGKRWVGVKLRQIQHMKPDMRAMGLPPSQENPPEE